MQPTTAPMSTRSSTPPHSSNPILATSKLSTGFFLDLAKRVEGYASKSPAKDSASQRVSRRDAFFRASAYYRAADFYLAGGADHSRIDSLWGNQTRCFDGAIALLSERGQRETLKSQDGSFEIPVIFYAASTGEALN